jgi:hypothetical protein
MEKKCKGLCKQCNNREYCAHGCHDQCYEECWMLDEEEAKDNWCAPTFCYEDCQCFLNGFNNY